MAATIFDYSQTPASNTALFPENMAPSALNDSARQVQADIAGGLLEVYTTGGAADAYTVTLSPAIASYTTTADLSFMAKVHTANLTTTPTVNVNGLGAKTIVDRAGSAVAAGALPTGCVVKFWYDGTNMRAVDVGGALTGSSLSITGTITGPSGTWDSGGMDLASSDTYAINGTDVLSATVLGSGVLASSLTSLGTIASLVATTADINGGTIDGAVIGGTTPAAATFTTATADNFVLGNGETLAWGDATTYIQGNAATDTINLYAGGGIRVTVSATGIDTNVDFSSGIKSASASEGVGYATGAGGTVTQTGSKATAVELNTTVGKITTHAANLNAATSVTFTFTNSRIAANDLVIVNLGGGGASFGAYTVQCEGHGSGSRTIHLRNETAGTLGEAIDIMFAVIKGVTS